MLIALVLPIDLKNITDSAPDDGGITKPVAKDSFDNFRAIKKAIDIAINRLLLAIPA
jgi:hypothetical protein